MEGAGCDDCNNTGYRAAQGVYEVMPITPSIRELILRPRARPPRSRRRRSQRGDAHAAQDALSKLKRGMTTVEEVLKETAADNAVAARSRDARPEGAEHDA